jgi:hypothetical protein
MGVMVGLAAVLLLLTATMQVDAQPPPPPLSNAQPVDRAEPPVLPDPPAGENAWRVKVSSTGGITGRGLGTVTIGSDGQVSCAPTACATPVDDRRLKRVAEVLNAIGDGDWIKRPPGRCNDCMQTTITLKRRSKDGIVTSVATWDDSETVGAELSELRRLVLELRTSTAAR